jgi:hypothetical protein
VYREHEGRDEETGATAENVDLWFQSLKAPNRSVLKNIIFKVS